MSPVDIGIREYRGRKSSQSGVGLPALGWETHRDLERSLKRTKFEEGMELTDMMPQSLSTKAAIFSIAW